MTKFWLTDEMTHTVITFDAEDMRAAIVHARLFLHMREAGQYRVDDDSPVIDIGKGRANLHFTTAGFQLVEDGVTSTEVEDDVNAGCCRIEDCKKLVTRYGRGRCALHTPEE